MLISLLRFVDRDTIMRFRGGGVGHMSTRAATDFFKHDRDILDMKSRRARQEEYAPRAPPNVEDDDDDDSEDMDTDGSEVGEPEIYHLEDDDLSESELVDYGYEVDGEEEDEEDDRDVREDDGTIIDELGALDFGEY
jgi:hypothetical protein